jgi:GDP-4-dehydro-6-deoxy-D-mannose reductase
MERPVLVTGAAGFAGSHLLDLLCAAQAPLVAWHRPGDGRARRADVRWQAVDLLDRETVEQSIAALKPSAIYHCAGAAHVGRAWEQAAASLAANVRGTHFVFEALREHNIAARVLIPSSAMVYAPADAPLSEDSAIRPSSPYGLSKLAQELVATGTTPATTSIARAFNHFGPRQDPFFAASDFARRIADIEAGRADAVIAVGNLDAKRDFTDVRDTVRAYRAIAEKGPPNRVYNVCSGRATQIGELLDMLLTRARTAVRIKIDPARYRPHDDPVIVGDPTRIREELEWSPVIPTEQTVEDLLSYWRYRTMSAC